MKCEKCGKNEANFYYRSNINGNVTERHLCSECAGEMEQENNEFTSFFADTDRFFNSMFDGFFGGSLFGRSGLMGRSLAMPMLFPQIQIRLDDGSLRQNAAPAETGKTETSAETDPELAKRREVNMLRSQMQEAAAREDFEKAAELRDKLRALEEQK